MELYDFHCHLDFFAEGGEVPSLGGMAGFLNCTVTPEDFAEGQRRFHADTRVHTAVGLHPWYVAEDPAQAARQAEAVCRIIDEGQTLIGEVGLDFGPKHAHTREVQVAAFAVIAKDAAGTEGAVMSIHSVQATETVLDILEQSGFFAAGGTAVFHWYSGSSAHLTRGLSLGARYSVNPRMLATKRGREYARVIPAERLLTETDLPAEDGTLPESIPAVLTALLGDMAAIRGVSADELAACVARNSRNLLSGAKPAGTCKEVSR